MSEDRLTIETIPCDDNQFCIRATYKPDWELIHGMAWKLKKDIEEGRVIAMIGLGYDSKD